jgi:uncharacterized damage-inducible protein DinB
MSVQTTITAVQDELRRTERELLAALDEADTDSLCHRAAEGVWSLSQVLSHISEARRFWIGEILRVKANPGARMGRTLADAGRLAAVENPEKKSREMLRAALSDSHAELMAGLAKIHESDMEIVGEHVKFGRQTLRELIQHFILEHDQKHVQQARRCLAQAQGAAQ